MNIPSVFSLIDTLCIFLCGGVIVNVAKSQISYLKEIHIAAGSTKILVVIFVCYLVGLFFHRLVERLSRKLRRSPKLMFLSLDKYMSGKNDTDQKCSYASFHYGFPFIVCLFFSNCKCSALTELYDKCYTEICKNNMIGDIKVLEGQLAFVRNSIFLLPVLLFYCNNLCVCCKVMCILVSFLVLAKLWGNIQMKQFEMVWDYAYYLNEVYHSNEYNKTLSSIKNLKSCIL